jgi:hypothetical protein
MAMMRLLVGVAAAFCSLKAIIEVVTLKAVAATCQEHLEPAACSQTKSIRDLVQVSY